MARYYPDSRIGKSCCSVFRPETVQIDNHDNMELHEV
jgi:hypothetical protein